MNRGLLQKGLVNPLRMDCGEGGVRGIMNCKAVPSTRDSLLRTPSAG